MSSTRPFPASKTNSSTVRILYFDAVDLSPDQLEASCGRKSQEMNAPARLRSTASTVSAPHSFRPERRGGGRFSFGERKGSRQALLQMLINRRCSAGGEADGMQWRVSPVRGQTHSQTRGRREGRLWVAPKLIGAVCNEITNACGLARRSLTEALRSARASSVAISPVVAWRAASMTALTPPRL